MPNLSYLSVIFLPGMVHLCLSHLLVISIFDPSKSIRRPFQRTHVLDLLDSPPSLEDEPGGPKGFRYTGPKGRSLEATGVPTSCD